MADDRGGWIRLAAVQGLWLCICHILGFSGSCCFGAVAALATVCGVKSPRAGLPDKVGTQSGEPLYPNKVSTVPG